jgi:multidrug efflux system membrane fusion protein
MKLQRSWLLTLIITFVVVLWVLSGALTSSGTSQLSAISKKATELIKVRVKASIAKPLTNRLVLQGQTLADRKVTVSAETAGKISKVLVERGDRVNVGEELIRLALEERKVRLQEAKSLVAQRQTEYKAVLALRESGYQAENEQAKAKAALDAAESALEIAKLELKRINIKAPITGIVNNRLVEVGDFVSRGDPMAIVVDLDPIRVVGQISEHYLGQIKLGKQGEVRLLDGTIVNAVVTYVGSVASDTTRTFPVEMEVPNPDGLIIEGVTAELHLPIQEITAHQLPPSVLSLLDNGTLSVKAVNDSSEVVAYAVEVLGDSKDGIWLGGLPDQLRLVVVGHEFVKPGQKVIAVSASYIEAKASD